MRYQRQYFYPFDEKGTSLFEDKNIRNILSSERLQAGWSFGEGEPILKGVITKATKIYLLSIPYGLSIEVYPTLQGGVSLTFYKKDHFLEVIINSDLSFDYIYEIGIGSKYKTPYKKKSANYRDLFNMLTKIKCVSAVSSPLTKRITVKRGKDLQVPVSRTRQINPAFLLSTMNVQNQLEYVPTYSNIMMS